MPTMPCPRCARQVDADSLKSIASYPESVCYHCRVTTVTCLLLSLDGVDSRVLRKAVENCNLSPAAYVNLANSAMESAIATTRKHPRKDMDGYYVLRIARAAVREAAETIFSLDRPLD